MNTQENNKLIAEFMGLKDGDKYLSPSLEETESIGLGMYVDSDEMRYHTSWDWLMPVVDKIESLSMVSFEKNRQEEGDYQCLFTKGNDIFICHYADTSVEATYQAVVEFINEYNKNK